MAKKGLSRLFMAKHSSSGGTDSYTEGCENEKLASYSSDIEVAEKSNLYLNNGIAESSGGGFNTGTLTLETGDLSVETSKLILNVKEQSVDGIEAESDLKEVVFDDDMGDTPPYLGVGLIELHQVNGAEFHRAIVLPKVGFNIPSDSATTKGESIEWQTQEITGTIYRADGDKHPWKRYADCKTEATAVAYIKKLLNITDPETVSTTEAGEQ